MRRKSVIDIYGGEGYDPARHFVREVFWSDAGLYYWGWIYGGEGNIVGDFAAQSMQDIAAALNVKFVER